MFAKKSILWKILYKIIFLQTIYLLIMHVKNKIKLFYKNIRLFLLHNQFLFFLSNFIMFNIRLKIKYILYVKYPTASLNLQIDNTLILADNAFAEIKNVQFFGTKLSIKKRKTLILKHFIKCNDDYLKQKK